MNLFIIVPRMYAGFVLYGLCILVSFTPCISAQPAFNDDDAIRISAENPMYWQYKGEPVLLLGGSVQDNLFQIENLEDHLDLLASTGGNYVRSTMSARDTGNAKPFAMRDGLYDLDEPNREYWDRFENLLQLAYDRDIIVQVEFWATYDFYWGDNGWAKNPFNPRINSSYTAKESGLPEVIDYPAQTANNPFFRSVPQLDDLTVVRAYQEQFVRELMSVALPYPNVLFCIDNETKSKPEWGLYWSDFIHRIASEAGRDIYVTQMWDNWDPTGGLVPEALEQHPDLGGWYAEHTSTELTEWAKPSNTINNPESYSFIDISNNNAQRGEVHYKTALFVRNHVLFSAYTRPVNNVKVYGGMMNTLGQDNYYWTALHKDGEERFWRNIFAGHASARFHRPDYGLGLNHVAQHHIQSMRMLTDEMDFYNHEPATHLLKNRDQNEAYCLAIEGEEYAVYFTGGGEVLLDADSGEYEVRWLQIRTAQWSGVQTFELPTSLKAPSNDQWAAFLRRL